MSHITTPSASPDTSFQTTIEVGDKDVRKTLSFIAESVLGISPDTLILTESNTFWARDPKVPTHGNKTLLRHHHKEYVEPSDWTNEDIRNSPWGEKNLKKKQSLTAAIQFPDETDECEEHKMKSSLEGGNVILFFQKGKPGAFVGMSSVIDTMKVLANCPSNQKKPPIDDHLFYRAINLIAQDLSISEENLIVLDHYHLHLDQTLLLSPKGFVFLGKNLPMSEKDRPGYLTIFNSNKKKIEEYGFEVIEISDPLSEWRGRSLLNGIFITDWKTQLLITNSPPIDKFRDTVEFVKVMTKHSIEVFFIEIDNPIVCGGGIHCLTNKKQGPVLDNAYSMDTIYVGSIVKNEPLALSHPKVLLFPKIDLQTSESQDNWDTSTVISKLSWSNAVTTAASKLKRDNIEIDVKVINHFTENIPRFAMLSFLDNTPASSRRSSYILNRRFEPLFHSAMTEPNRSSPNDDLLFMAYRLAHKIPLRFFGNRR